MVRSGRPKTTAAAGVIAALIAVLAIGGALFALGAARAPDSKDALARREAAYRTASRQARAEAYAAARREGRRRGVEQGARRGRAAGSRRGRSAGRSERKRRAAAAAAAAAARAAAQPTHGSFGGCSAPLFVDGYCPTPAEQQAENDLEGYCGGFDPSRVQADGSYLPKPGC